MEKFVAENKSSNFVRFYELSEIATVSLLGAVDPDFSLKWGPATFYRGVERELEEFCVPMR